MDTSVIESEIVEYVRQHDHVSFVEVKRIAAKYMDVEGDRAVAYPDDPNLCLWAGASKEFTDLICKMMHEQQIYTHPAPLVVYVADGGLLNMPIAKRIPTKGFKKPHWLPVCFRLVPFDAKEYRKHR